MIGIVLGIATGWAIFFVLAFLQWLIVTHAEKAVVLLITTLFGFIGWVAYIIITGNPI